MEYKYDVMIVNNTDEYKKLIKENENYYRHFFECVNWIVIMPLLWHDEETYKRFKDCRVCSFKISHIRPMSLDGYYTLDLPNGSEYGPRIRNIQSVYQLIEQMIREEMEYELP